MVQDAMVVWTWPASRLER